MLAGCNSCEHWPVYIGLNLRPLFQEARMQSAHRLLSAAVLAVASASSFATTLYTSSGSFLANIAPGRYTESFNALVNPVPVGPVAFSSGGFSYAVSAPGDLYASGEFLGTSLPNEAVTVTFTSGNVSAVGANFYAVNLSDEFQAVSLALTLSDGTIVSFTPTSVTDSYRGFASNVTLTSLTISAPGVSLYSGLDNLTVGVVPEPASWVLMGLGLTGLLWARRRAA
ncbi:MAG: PEP-CTERM sorting domain-containing protein [Chitinophagaceae bacterium]|nr:PEP-CTERM sorting domain-containing protein [Rubrivivax sp.]